MLKSLFFLLNCNTIMLLLNLILIGLVFLTQKTLAKPYECNQPYKYDATIKGEIKSPGYDSGSYPAGISCEYIITAPEGYRIKISFKDMDIYPSDNCNADKLVITGRDEDSIIGIFCGRRVPNPILSHEVEEEIRILFKTDGVTIGKGFHLEYEAAPSLDLCDEDEGVCRNRNCYQVGDICNGKDDCGDGTDEEECEKPVAVPSDDECGETPIKPATLYTSREIGIAAIGNSWPWQVSLQYANIEPNGHFCGGTLINPQWVLSAANCFKGIKHPSDIRITLGSHFKFNRTQLEVTRIAERIISFPDLEGDELQNADNRHDISLIKMNAPVAITDGVQPACLPYDGWETAVGWKCYSTGWGGIKGSGLSDVLKQSLHVVQHKDNCTHDEETQICVNNANESSCFGDTGGPLVCKLAGKWYLMGTTSFGITEDNMSSPCDTTHSKIIFGKVAHKGLWVRQVIDRNS